MSDHLKNLSQVYLEQIAESEKVDMNQMKPILSAVTGIPKADQMKKLLSIKKKTAEKNPHFEKSMVRKWMIILSIQIRNMLMRQI